MSKYLKGKRALVTGGTRGIGRAIAERLFSEGAQVIITGTKPDGDTPTGCEYRAVNFTDEKTFQEFTAQLTELSVDILINNAGINKIAPFAEINLEDFAIIQQVNVHAPFRLCRAALPGMTKKGWGRIVNICSIWGKISKSHRGAYSASKFALDGMTAALAAEVAKSGVLANCLSPGFIDTELTRSILGNEGISELTSQVPIGRLGTVTEIAAFAVWLAGPENTYISGQNIAIDGGFTRV